MCDMKNNKYGQCWAQAQTSKNNLFCKTTPKAEIP